MITSGPLLLLSVNGHDVGETIQASLGDSLEIRVSARSRRPLGRLEIVSNDGPIASIHTSQKKATLLHKITADEGRWFCARCSRSDLQDPMEEPDIAHTSAIYVHINGAPPLRKESVQRWRENLRQHKERVQRYGRFSSPDQLQEVLHHIQSAMDAYKALEE